MKEEIRKRIKEIMGGMNCPKAFKCVDSDFKHLCKAKDIGLDTHLDCLEENPRDCPFALSFGYSYMCQCPLRVYIAKNMKIDSNDKDAEQKDSGD